MVTSANYLAASAISFIIILTDTSTMAHISEALASFPEDLTSFIIHIPGILLNSEPEFPQGTAILWPVFIGPAAGVFFFLAFIFYQKSVRENGAGPSSMFGKLGILVPMCLSMLIWCEVPTAFGWIGIVLSVSAIILSSWTRGVAMLEKQGANLQVSLLFLLLLFMGIAEFSNKVFQQYGGTDYRAVFLFFVFLTAGILSGVLAFRKNATIRGSHILAGFIVGVPNLFSSYFLIMSLNTVKAAVAFPVFSAGGIALITIGSRALFKEKLTKKMYAAILLTAVAVVFINL